MPQLSRTPARRFHPTSRITQALVAGLAGLCGLTGAAAASETATPVASLTITEINTSTHPFTTLHCARQPVQVRFFHNIAEVVLNGKSQMLVQAMSASGARYVAPGDESTALWNKGNASTLTWEGQQLPVCAPAGAILAPWRASGNEPFWSITYDGWQATFTRPGADPQKGDATITATTSDSQSLQVGHGATTWQITATDGLCTDTMTGMPHPQHVSTRVGSETFHGCGGSPERLLQGSQWHFTHIGTQPVNPAAQAWIEFLPGNRIAGSSGCNRFFGTYTLTGEALTFDGLGSTRMACTPEAMTQEDALLKRLGEINGFSLSEPDTLTLRTPDSTLQANPSK
ncbi:MAG: META domain-containing protein [Alcaligenaceae bacterium]|nr:META domain-containing protein [Alcaligenaceae bacterium]